MCKGISQCRSISKIKGAESVKKLNRVLKNQSGQGMLEYVMLLAVVALVVLAFRGTITTKFQEWTGNVVQKTDQVLQ
jgi:Flp pilus assembly pilin Flp